MEELRKKSHNIYKELEKQASSARKKKEYERASRLFNSAARLRERHADTYYNGIMDEGHLEFYNNTVRAANNCAKKAINVKKFKATFNQKKNKKKKN